MTKVGKWRGMLDVQADDMEDIKYLFTSGGGGTERGKGLPAIPASKSGQALAAIFLCPTALWPTCVLPGCFILPHDDWSSGLQSDWRLVWQKTSTPRRCGQHCVWGLGLLQDDGLVLVLPTKKG